MTRYGRAFYEGYGVDGWIFDINASPGKLLWAMSDDGDAAEILRAINCCC